MRTGEVIALSIVLLSFAIAIYFYPLLPEKVASHWNALGEVDGYMSKFWGLFLMPVISIFVLALFVLIPRIDPLKANIEEFRKYFDGFIVLLMLFLLYLYLLTIFWNIGARFNMIQLLVPAFGVLFYYVGILTENARRNWFIGIRTPWTLSSEKVWEKTHRVGGKLFKIAGIIALIGVFFQSYALLFVLAPVIFVAVYTVVYSFVEYQKELRH